MDEESNAVSYGDNQFPEEAANVSFVSLKEREELAKHIAFLESELSNKDRVIKYLRDSAESSPQGSTVDVSDLAKTSYLDIANSRNELVVSLSETLESEKKKVKNLTDELYELKMMACLEVQKFEFKLEHEMVRAQKQGLALKNTYEKKIDELTKEREYLESELNESKVRENKVREQLTSIVDCNFNESDVELWKNKIECILNELNKPAETISNAGDHCECRKLEGQIKDLEEKLCRANSVIEIFTSELGCLNIAFDEIFKLISSVPDCEAVSITSGTDLVENESPGHHVLHSILSKMKKCYSGVQLLCRLYSESETESNRVKSDLSGKIKEMEYKLEEIISEKEDVEKKLYRPIELVADKNEPPVSHARQYESLKHEHEALIKDHKSLKVKFDEIVKELKEHGSPEESRKYKIDKLVSNFGELSNIAENLETTVTHTPDFANGRTTDTGMATSTPFPAQAAYLFGGGESLQDDDSALTSPIKWIEKCLALEKDNVDLKKQVEQMQYRIVELEMIDQDVQNQIACLDNRRKELMEQMKDYKVEEKKRVDACEKNKIYELKIAHLEDKLKVVQDENEKLCSENKLLENKHQDLLDLCRKEGKINANDKFWKDWNKTIHEVIHLKGRIKLYEISTDKLKTDLAKMFEKQSYYILKLSELSTAWSAAKQELVDAYSERLELSTEIRKKEQEVNFLKLKLKHLFKRSVVTNDAVCCTTADEIHREALELCRRVFEQKLTWEKVPRESLESNELVTAMDARHRYELTAKDNQQLIFEKQRLLEQIAEQQKMISDLQIDVGFDEGWLLRFDEVQAEFIKEVKYHREQHARIEEALRSTGKLHDQLQKEKDALRLKALEIIKLEKKLEEETFARRETENKNHALKDEIDRKNTLTKLLDDEKIALEEKLSAVETELANVKVQLAHESRLYRWREKCVKLDLVQEDIADRCRMISDKGDKCLEDNFLDAKALAEQHYQEALQRMKYYYHAQFTSMAIEEEEEHKKQIESLTQVIKEQALAIEKCTAENILKGISNFLSMSKNPVYDELLDSLNNLKNETDILLEKIESPLRDTLRQKMKDQILHQLSLSHKVLMDDHYKQHEILIDSINQVHREEIKIVKLRFEANKYRELLEESSGTDEPNSCLLELNESSRLCDSLSYEPDSKISVVFSKALRIFLNHFSTKLKEFLKLWYPVYETKIKDLKKELNKVLSDYEAAPLNFADNEADLSVINSLLTEQNECTLAAKNFVALTRHYEESLTDRIKQVVDDFVHKTESSFEDIKIKISRESDILLLKEQLKQIKIEKEDLEKSHQSALLLLKSDYDADVKNTQRLLSELKSCSEARCDSNALLNLRAELEAKHKREVEELRTYFEEKCSELQKHFSEDIFSQHSKKMSNSSSCSENDLHSEHIFDAEDCIPCQRQEGFGDNNSKTRDSRGEKLSTTSRELSNAGLAAPVNKDLVLAECSVETDKESRRLNESSESDSHEDFVVRRCNTFQAEWEDLLEQMGSSIVWKSMSNVNGEIFKDMKEYMETVLTKNVKDLSNLIEGEMNKMKLLVSQQSFRLNSLLEKVVTLRRKLSIEPSNALSPDAKLEIEKKAVLNFINSVRAHLESECLDDEDATNVSGFQELKMLVTSFQSSRNHKEADIEESGDEVELLVKERNYLRSLVCNLQTVCRQFEAYVRTSEDELLKNICDELKQICEKTCLEDSVSATEGSVTGDEWPSKLAPNLQSFVKELNETLTSEQLDDLSPHFMDELKVCLNKLKTEASALLGITSNLQRHPSGEIDLLSKELYELQKENEELRNELNEFKRDFEDHRQSVFDYGAETESDQPDRASADLRQRVVRFAQSKQDLPHDTLKIMEELANEGDKLIEELSKERDELQQKFTAADRQLRSTWKYLEEQTVERETERDEFSKELLNLSAQLEEKGKETSARLRINSEIRPRGAQENGSAKNVEELCEELRETQNLLSESKSTNKRIESELKAAVDKVWVLQDIITDLEKQLLAKSERESALEERLDAMEAEFEHQSGAQNEMALELESLRNQSIRDVSLDQIQELQESIKIKFSSSVVRQLKEQLRDMEKTLDAQTKELSSNVTACGTSLSSPSEEISLREQLDRSKTPEHCPSPVALPVDEVNRLHEAIQRHARSDEVALKRVRDQEIRITKLSNYIEELQAERDILQKKVENQMALTAEANNKLDRIRHKLSSAYNEANDQFTVKHQELTKKQAETELIAQNLRREVDEKSDQLRKAEKIISSLQDKLRSMANSDHSTIDSLRLELASVTSSKNQLEEIVDKLQKERGEQESNTPNFSADFVDAMLSEKNDCIERLEKTVASLQNSQSSKEQSSSCNSKGHRVSFAVDVETSSNISEGDKLRDAPQEQSYSFFGSPAHDEKEPNSSDQQTNPANFTFNTPLSPIVMPEVPSMTAKEAILENELREKAEKIALLEKQLSDFKSLKQDYIKAKAALEMAVTSVSEDKEFYERQLKSASEESANKEAKIRQLLQEIQEKNAVLSATVTADDLRKREERILNLENLVAQKNSELLKTRAEIKALQNVSKNLQLKLKEARQLAEGHCVVELQSEVDRLKVQLQDAGQLLDSERLLGREVNSKNNKLTEEVESLKNQVFSLTSSLQATESKFQEYLSSVRNLKNELFSIKDNATGNNPVKEGLTVSSLDEDGAIEQLQSEVSKLISKFGQIEFERNQLQTEWTSHKRNCSLNELRRKEMDIEKLNSRIRQLELESTRMSTTHKKEVTDLLNTIQQLREEVGSLRRELQEAEIESRLNREKAENRMVEAALDCSGRLASGEKTDLPELLTKKDQETSFDEKYLQGHMTKSASADGSNLQQSLASLQKTVRDRATLIKELRERIYADEKLVRSLTILKHELEGSVHSLEKMNKVQSRKIQCLTEELQEVKNKLILTELTSATERENRVRVEAELEKLKVVSRATQREDINLIENMRGRLQVLMETEVRLKATLADEQLKNERLQAEMNSLRELLEEYKRNYLALTVELEKEQRTYSDLHCVLTRERKTLLSIQAQLKVVEKEKDLLGKECAALKITLEEEKNKQDKMEESVKNHQYPHSANRNEYDVESLHDYYRHAERNKRREDSHVPALQEIDVLKKNIEELLKNRTELIRSIEHLTSEKRLLNNQVDQLREERNKIRLDSPTMDFPPTVLANLDAYLGKYFRAECCRKALIFQKKYLLVSLNGYEDLHKKALRTLKLQDRRPRKPSFKTAAILVLSIFRMKSIIRKRATSYQVAFLGVLRAFGHSSKESLRNPELHRDELPGPSTDRQNDGISLRPSKNKPQSCFQSEYLKALDEIQFLTSLL